MSVQQNDEKWMSLALSLARAGSEQGEVPVGAVLVQQDQVLAASANRREAECDPTAHAEIVVLRKAAQQLNRWNLSDCTMYVTLEPCPMCMGAILMARVPRVVCASRNHKLGAAGTVLPLHDFPGLDLRSQIEYGLFEEEAASVIKEFFQQRRPPGEVAESG